MPLCLREFGKSEPGAHGVYRKNASQPPRETANETARTETVTRVARANEPSGEFSWIRKRREQRLWHPQSFSGLRSQLRFAIGKHSETERGENNARSGAKQARPVPASRHRLVRLKTKRPIHLPAIETRSRSFRSSEEAATHRACELCSTLVGIVAGAF
jgi:hypothetical protein